MNYHDEKRTVSRGAVYSIAGYAAGALLGGISGAIMMRLFGQSDAGLWIFGLSIITLFEPFARCGLTEGVQRFVAVQADKRDWPAVKGTIIGSVQIGLAASVMVVALLWFIAPELADFFTRNTEHADHVARVATVIRVYAFYLIPMVLFTIMLAAHRALKNIMANFYLESLFVRLAWIALILVIGLTPLAGDKIVILITCSIGSVAIAAIIAAISFRRVIPQIFTVSPVFARQALLLFSLPLIFQNIVLILMKQVDKLMLKYFYSFDDIAVYNWATVIAIQAGLMLNAFASLFSPMIAAVYHRGDLRGLQHLYQTVTRWVLITSLPIIGRILLVPDLALQWFNITPSSTACATVIILTLGQLVSISVGHSGYMLIMSGHTKMTLANNSVALVINICLNWILIPRFGLPGAAVATLIAIAIRNVLSMLQVKILLHASPFSVRSIRTVVFTLCAMIAVFAFRWFVPEIYWLTELIACAVIFGAVYLPLMWFGMDREDKQFISSILSTKQHTGGISPR